MRIDDVAQFRCDPGAFEPLDVFLVVKSQDQLERRARLIAAVQSDRIGRFEQRPVAEGLVVAATLAPGRKVERTTCAVVRTYREPRGLVLLDDGTMLVAEIDRILHVDGDGGALREYRHPLFAFLHSIELSADGKRLLVVSSGYDILVELDLASGAPVWEWLTWEHGFNPSHDGVYLARKPELYRDYVARGLKALLVEPAKLGAHGLMTRARTNHPNSACYHPRDPDTVLATLGHSGEAVAVARGTGQWRRVVDDLASMPHGIAPQGEGWLVTSTLRGEGWFLSADFEVERKLIFANLPGKPPALAESEWLQMVQPLSDQVLLGLDANRGLILVNTAKRCYANVPIDEEWCVHLCVSAARENRRRAVLGS